MDAQSPQEMHADPRNWRWGIFYVNPADPRLVVPKRLRGLGWTLNFGRPAAIPYFVVFVAALITALVLIRRSGLDNNQKLLAKLALAGVVVGVSIWVTAIVKRGENGKTPR